MQHVKTFISILAFVAMTGMSYAQFSPQVRVGNLEYNPDIALDNTGNIYVVGEGWRGVYPEIFVSKSIDAGVNFSSDVPVTMQTAGFIEKPAVAIDPSGNIHIVYLSHDYYISYAKSTNGGVSFTTPVNISDLPASVLTRPKIAVYGNNIYVVWHYDDTDYRIYLDKSIAGAGFGTDVRVNDITTGVRGYPSVTVGAGETIYVTWADNNKVRIAKSTNQGASFGASVRVDDSDSDARNPSVATFGTDTVYIAWEDYRNVDSDIRFAKSTNAGVNFGASIKINDDTGDSDQRFPRMAIDTSGTIYAVWQDGRSDSTLDIYYANSTNEGASFSANLEVNSVPGKASYGHKNPALTVTDKVYVAWQGSIATLSGWQIYFSKGPLATVPLPPTTGSISGKVTKSNGVTGISGASVKALQDDAVISEISTDAGGNYSLSLSTGKYKMQVIHPDYISQVNPLVTVNTGITTTVNFSVLSGQVVLFDEFNQVSLDTSKWNIYLTGIGYQSLAAWDDPTFKSVVLNSGYGGAGSAVITSKDTVSVSSGLVIFEGRINAYEDNNTAYGDGQPRGLCAGTDRNNAIEFISATGSSIQARTVRQGIVTTTNYNLGETVRQFKYVYRIEASSTQAKFYLNNNLIATHTTNIPTVPLNIYLGTDYSGGGNVNVGADYLLLGTQPSLPTAPTKTSPADDIALHADASLSDNGWGGGSSKSDITDGIRTYDGEWARGLAFGYGEWHQATIDFGHQVTFDRVIQWYHGGMNNNEAAAYKLQYWNGSNWVDIFETNNSHAYLKYPDASESDWWYYWSTPYENTFAPVVSDKLRILNYPRDGSHTWLYEVEVYNTAPAATQNLTSFPTSFILQQNYPNPFNPATTISFSLPSKSFVSLKVFDLMGREVAVVIAEELSAGNYSLQWNAEGFPSGVYFYRLQAGTFTETKKLILLR